MLKARSRQHAKCIIIADDESSTSFHFNQSQGPCPMTQQTHPGTLISAKEIRNVKTKNETK
jgi:hypothetical protein